MMVTHPESAVDMARSKEESNSGVRGKGWFSSFMITLALYWLVLDLYTGRVIATHNIKTSHTKQSQL